MNLKWRRELPTKPGWYWIRQTYPVGSMARIEMGVAEVRNIGGELAVGNTTFRSWLATKQFEWAGPIPEPEE